jgi:putative sigma-54 modulation protein
VNAHVIFSLEKYRHRVEITLHVNGKDFVSVEESEDMYISVDKSVDKLENQLRKHKDKIKRRKAQQSISEAAMSLGDTEVEDEDTETDQP